MDHKRIARFARAARSVSRNLDYVRVPMLCCLALQHRETTPYAAVPLGARRTRTHFWP